MVLFDDFIYLPLKFDTLLGVFSVIAMPLLFESKLISQPFEENTHFKSRFMHDIDILFSISLLVVFNEVDGILITILLAFEVQLKLLCCDIGHIDSIDLHQLLVPLFGH